MPYPLAAAGVHSRRTEKAAVPNSVPPSGSYHMLDNFNGGVEVSLGSHTPDVGPDVWDSNSSVGKLDGLGHLVPQSYLIAAMQTSGGNNYKVRARFRNTGIGKGTGESYTVSLHVRGVTEAFSTNVLYASVHRAEDGTTDILLYVDDGIAPNSVTHLGVMSLSQSEWVELEVIADLHDATARLYDHAGVLVAESVCTLSVSAWIGTWIMLRGDENWDNVQVEWITNTLI